MKVLRIRPTEIDPLALPVFAPVEIADVLNEYFAVSLYKGVWVGWDEDYDPRILGWIDTLPDWERNRLILAHEHEGGLFTYWTGDCPTVGQEHIDIYNNMAYVDGWFHQAKILGRDESEDGDA